MSPLKIHGSPAIAAVILAGLFLAPAWADAATMSASATAPLVNGLDIANYGAVTGNDKWFAEDSGVGTATVAAGTSDRIFHLDLQHPMKPGPDFGATVPAGDLTLSWTNMTPTTGTDVWVDVWFGTNAGAMTKVADKQQNLASFLVNLPGASTYHWRIDSYLDGAPTGTPVQGTVFNFIVTDSDGDGFPDAYELLHAKSSTANVTGTATAKLFVDVNVTQN